jgi:zinc transport system substrate-binding protein
VIVFALREENLMKPIHLLIVALLLMLVTEASASERLSVYTVNYPLAYFAERIGGDQVEVVFPAPADVDPVYWMPDQKIITAYQQADLILLNGANYAKWISKVSMPRSKMLNTSRKFKNRYIYTPEVTTHSHGAAGSHAHESLAFTTWLDLSLAKLQADAVYKALVLKRPTAEMEFKRNFQALAVDLEKLHARTREIVSKDPDRALLGSHPVYDYLSAGYGMNLKSVHWEPDEVPTVSQWNELSQILAEHQAKDMLWEGTPLADTVAKLKDKGIDSVIFNPGGNRPDLGDFMSVMQQNIANLEQVFK